MSAGNPYKGKGALNARSFFEQRLENGSYAANGIKKVVYEGGGEQYEAHLGGVVYTVVPYGQICVTLCYLSLQLLVAEDLSNFTPPARDAIYNLLKETCLIGISANCIGGWRKSLAGHSMTQTAILNYWHSDVEDPAARMWQACVEATEDMPEDANESTFQIRRADGTGVIKVTGGVVLRGAHN